jgi:hypothetical protein
MALVRRLSGRGRSDAAGIRMRLTSTSSTGATARGALAGVGSLGPADSFCVGRKCGLSTLALEDGGSGRTCFP